MTVGQLAVIAAAVLLSSLVQVVAGFGFGLLSVPLMTLVVHPQQAVVVSTLLGITMTSWQAWHLRRDVDMHLVKYLTIPAFVGMPFGLWLSGAVSQHTLQIALGVIVLIAVIVLAARVNLHHSGPGLDVVAGFASGLLNTSLSTNGPPLVFVLQARQLTPAVFRSTISRVFCYSAVLAVVLFVANGRVNRDGLISSAVAFPALAVGQVVGFPLRRHVDGERFRVLVLTLLTLAACSAIYAALR